MHHTSQPSSSRQTTFHTQPPSPPRVTKDIMDDIEPEEKHDALPISNFDITDEGDDDDINGDVDIGQHDEPNNSYADPMMIFSQQVNVAQDHDVMNMAFSDT